MLQQNAILFIINPIMLQQKPKEIMRTLNAYLELNDKSNLFMFENWFDFTELLEVVEFR
jgi:hypothetical protein